MLTVGLFWFISELINTTSTHLPGKSEALTLDFLTHIIKEPEKTYQSQDEDIVEQEAPESISTPDISLELPDINYDLESFSLPNLTTDIAISVPQVTQGLSIEDLKSGKGLAIKNSRDLTAVRENALTYPPAARRKRIEGWVTFNYLVNKDGSVSDIEIIESSPPRMFDRVVIKEVSKWKYLPRIENGSAVATRVVERKYVFKL